MANFDLLTYPTRAYSFVIGGLTFTPAQFYIVRYSTIQKTNSFDKINFPMKTNNVFVFPP